VPFLKQLKIAKGKNEMKAAVLAKKDTGAAELCNSAMFLRAQIRWIYRAQYFLWIIRD